LLDNDPRRHAAELSGRDTHQNSPRPNTELLPVTGYSENAAWPPARHGDARLGPDAGPLYGKSAAQYGQTLARQPDTAVTQPVTWTTGGEVAVAHNNTPQRSTATPGLFTVII